MQEGQSFIPRIGTLTEDDVKRRFVPFLRDFYKNRYEALPHSVAVELDNVSKEGWVADGKITFRKTDGSPFICTYEATSRDKSAEVKFRRNNQYFLWDCIAFAGVFGTITYAIFYETRFKWLVEMKLTGNIGLVLGVGLIGFFSWYFLMQNWRKYRYIYAIQQFRQYFADEQWVAIAEDVFPAPSDPYMLELRNQCVYHGIGLAIVPLEGKVRKVIDPSRLGIFGKDRKITQWVTRATWYRSLSQNVETMVARRPKTPDTLTALWNKIFRPVHYLVYDPVRNIGSKIKKPIDQTTAVYSRFMRSQPVQKWVFALTLFVTIPLFWKVVTFTEDKVWELEGLELRPNGVNPEDQPGYLLEKEHIPEDGEPTGVSKQYPISSKKQLAEESNTINLSGDDQEEVTGIEEVPDRSRPAPLEGCPTLQRGRGWFVQDDAFSEQYAAVQRATELRRNGFEAHWASQHCIAEDRSGWLVWIGKIYADEASAEKAALQWARDFDRLYLTKGHFLVRKLH